MSDFEQFIGKQVFKPVPPEWRREMLTAPGRPDAARTPWWEFLAWPSPVAWKAVAACWLVAISLQVLTRLSGPAPEPAARDETALLFSFIRQRQAMALINTAAPSSPAALSPRPAVLPPDGRRGMLKPETGFLPC